MLRSCVIPNITISGTVVNFPDSSASPNWAPAVIQFAQLVEIALTLNSGNFDIAPQVYTMVANINTNVSIPNLAFPTSEVRAAFIQYSVFRTTDSATAPEAGDLIAVYNPNGATNSKWQIIRRYDSDGFVTFSMTDGGQVQFSSTALAGSNHSGRISFTARTLLQE